jgi:hypothetical protein
MFESIGRANTDPVEGHAGDCLKIRDAFNDTMLHFIGENDSQGDGRARLARLSFRALRSMARLPTELARIREARRLSDPISGSTSAKEREIGSVTSSACEPAGE